MHFEQFLDRFFFDPEWKAEQLRRVRQDLSGQKKGALLNELPVFFESQLQSLRKKAHRELWKWLGLGMGASAVPVPLLDYWLGFLPEQQLKKSLLKIYGFLQEENRHLLPNSVVVTKAYPYTKKHLLGRKGKAFFKTAIAISQKTFKGRIAKFVPLVGTALAVGYNTHSSNQLGKLWITLLETELKKQFATELKLQSL